MGGGDLSRHLHQRHRGLGAGAARFYLASVLLGLEALHAVQARSANLALGGARHTPHG